MTTNLVTITVTVHDKSGNPVRDLTKDNFVLFDEGYRQKIATFSLESDDRSKPVLLKLEPGMYSNLPISQNDIKPNVSAILLDGLNTHFTDQAYALDQVVHFLKQIQPQDNVALYMLGNRLAVLHDFTSDKTALLEALASYHGSAAYQIEPLQVQPVKAIGGTSAAEAAEIAKLNASIKRAMSEAQYVYTKRRVEITLEALNAIARHLQGVPGRKSLVWVSSSFPLTLGKTRNFNPEIEHTAQLLSEANVSVYPVDARGLIGPDLTLDKPDAPKRPSIAYPNPMPGPDARTFQTMSLLADRTGGRAFYNSNDIASAVRQAIDDGHICYVLGYYPDHTKWNGQFHSVKIKVDRKGIVVRSRPGYYAVPESQGVNQAELERVTQSPLNATGIGFAARILGSSSTDPNKFAVQIILDAHTLHLVEDSEHRSATLTAYFIQSDEKGRTMEAKQRKLDLRLLSAEYEKAIRDGVEFQTVLGWHPEVTDLCVVIQDQDTGATGSVHIRTSGSRQEPAGPD